MHAQVSKNGRTFNPTVLIRRPACQGSALWCGRCRGSAPVKVRSGGVDLLAWIEQVGWIEGPFDRPLEFHLRLSKLSCQKVALGYAKTVLAANRSAQRDYSREKSGESVARSRHLGLIRRVDLESQV